MTNQGTMVIIIIYITTVMTVVDWIVVFYVSFSYGIESSKYFCFLSVMIIIQFKIKVTKHNLMMYPYPKSFQRKKRDRILKRTPGIPCRFRNKDPKRWFLPVVFNIRIHPFVHLGSWRSTWCRAPPWRDPSGEKVVIGKESKGKPLNEA